MKVWELAIELDAELADAAGAALFDAGAGGVEERETESGTELVVWADDRELLEQLEATARRFGAPRVRELDDSWRTEWTRHLGQERVCDGFVLQPVGDDTPAPEGTTPIVFRPELAFGVGSHPTTRLAARAVERVCRARPGGQVLDVGTGTGVLALIALHCGARAALGIDIDPVSVQVAHDNAELNGLGARARFETVPLGELSPEFDLVIANLEAPVQLELAAELRRLTRPGATLLVTGFLVERQQELAQRLALAIVREDREDGWCLLELGA